MTYPRQCPLCGADYGAGGANDLGHVTVRSDPGGTPSSWRPDLPGRLLTLRCLTCRATFPWDYFAQGVPAARPGRRAS